MSAKKKIEPQFDEENPEWTEEDFARAKPASEVLRRAFYPPSRRRGAAEDSD